MLNEDITAEEKPSTSEKLLTQADYLLRYMHTDVQQSKARIYIKKSGQNIDGKEESFLTLWKQQVSSRVKIHSEFKNGKLILHNYRDDIGMTFSQDFSKTFFMKDPFFGKGSRWSTTKSGLKSGHDSEKWYIDIFSLTLEMSHVNKYQHLSTSLYPWRCKTMKQVIYLLNSQVKTLLQDTLKETYDEKNHRFQLTLGLNDYCKLELGRWLEWCYFSKNLSYLLGFPNVEIKGNKTHAQREVDSLANHSRQLHVISNVIKPTAYGKQQRQILCDFLHERHTLPMVEKRFNPISYHPVTRNNIDMIRVQLTDGEYNPISIQNSTTIVTLYFRKVK